MKLNSHFSILIPSDISNTEKILLCENGLLRSVSFKEIRGISQNDISLFCHKHAVYQIVTTELVRFIAGQINGFKTIEIGSGNGCLGRALGIPLTDNRMQERPEILAYYREMKQPAIIYPKDVGKYDALDAIKIFGCDAAVGSWVTHKKKPHLPDGNMYGVDEAVLSQKLKRYVFIGNEITHQTKELLRISTPKVYKFDWLISRSMNKEANVIWVFDF